MNPSHEKLLIEGESAGLAFIDIFTGEFATAQLSCRRALIELERLRPAEILTPEGMDFPARVPSR